MIAFALIASGMVVVATTWVVMPLLRRSATADAGRRWMPAALGAFLVSAAASLYLALGAPGSIAPPPPAASRIDAMVARLAARMEREPDDAAGWIRLARAYSVLQRPDEAVAAYARALDLLPGDANLIADYADALGTAQGGTLAGKPLALVRRALAIDPDNPRALALAGAEAFDRAAYREALAYWDRVQAPEDTAFARSLAASIARARALVTANRP